MHPATFALDQFGGRAFARDVFNRDERSAGATDVSEAEAMSSLRQSSAGRPLKALLVASLIVKAAFFAHRWIAPARAAVRWLSCDPGSPMQSHP